MVRTVVQYFLAALGCVLGAALILGFIYEIVTHLPEILMTIGLIAVIAFTIIILESRK